MSHRRRVLTAVLTIVMAAAMLGACSDSEGGNDAGAPTTEAAIEPLRILVSNDDSYAAPGIDVLVEGLMTLDDVEVTVVAPLDERSGAGGKSTDGEAGVTEVETAGGRP